MRKKVKHTDDAEERIRVKEGEVKNNRALS